MPARGVSPERVLSKDGVPLSPPRARVGTRHLRVCGVLRGVNPNSTSDARRAAGVSRSPEVPRRQRRGGSRSGVWCILVLKGFVDVSSHTHTVRTPWFRAPRLNREPQNALEQAESAGREAACPRGASSTPAVPGGFCPFLFGARVAGGRHSAGSTPSLGVSLRAHQPPAAAAPLPQQAPRRALRAGVPPVLRCPATPPPRKLLDTDCRPQPTVSSLKARTALCVSVGATR